MSKTPRTALLMHPLVMQELFRDDHLSRLDSLCELVNTTPCRVIDELEDELGFLEVIITSYGCPPITDEVLAAMPRLRLIAHLAGSVKGFIDDVAWRRGITVVNAVAANAVPVAEFTVAAILFGNKRVFQLNRAYQQTRAHNAPWEEEAPQAGNYKKTVGIVGASHVGRLVVEYLKAFDFSILVYDPYITPLEARHLGAQKVGLTELLSGSDVVSLHPPLLAETRHMIGGRELSLMRQHATLINTARGAIVDQDALEAELVQGRLFAVLDTTVPEPLPRDNVLYRLPNVYLTPHIAGSLGTETQRLTDYILDELERYQRGRNLKYRVRREDLARLS